jgi:hypothetical protein
MSNYLPHTIVPLRPRMGPKTRLGSMFFSSSIATSPERRSKQVTRGRDKQKEGSRAREEQWEGSMHLEPQVHFLYICFLKKIIVLMSNYLPHNSTSSTGNGARDASRVLVIFFFNRHVSYHTRPETHLGPLSYVPRCISSCHSARGVVWALSKCFFFL